jgi:hypothetical protein
VIGADPAQVGDVAAPAVVDHAEYVRRHLDHNVSFVSARW